MKQAQEAFSKVDTKAMTSKLNQAVNFMKKKMQDFKKSTQNNEIAIKVNNKDAQKQISQIQKQIDSLQEKINARQIKLNMITPKLDEITNKTTKAVTPDGVNSDSPAIQKTINNSLAKNKEYNTLLAQESKMTQEIAMYNKQLDIAKSKMAQLSQQTSQTATTQNKMSSFFSGFKQKIEQVKPSISNIKNSFSQMPKYTQNITNNIKNMGTGVKNGLGHILKYAGALLSLRGIYSTLNNCANTWLSSQNAGAKQLSANIDYMKYAMGSAFAPVIQWVTNLVYNLMKAIQSVVYALFKVNIFANASAKSYSAMAGSAKKAKQETKQLAGIHDEINNIQDNGNSDNGSGSGGGVTPSFDLSNVNPTNSILDAIKNGNWYEVGAMIGQKLNDAMNSIPWGKIQNTARKIGKNIALFLNGFIATTDWDLVGNTIAQGLNTAVYFGYEFITTFDWKQFGKAISRTINGFFKNTDWKTIGKTFSEGIGGILDAITGALSELDWRTIVDAIISYFEGLDFSLVTSKFFEALGSALGSFANLLTVLDEKKQELIDNVKNWFSEKFEECGGNVVEGFFKGIGDALASIGQWIYDNIFKPFIDGFKNAFGIHSPSKVMEEQGTYIIQGLFNGIQSLVDIITNIWQNMKGTAIQIFNNVKESVITIWNNIKTSASSIWDNIKNTASSVFNGIKDTISNAFNAVKNTITNIWNGIANTISNVWNTIVSKVKQGVSGAWTAITSVFGNISGWFRDKFSQAWQAVKNVFSTGGAIFDGIKDGILSGLKSIVNAIITGINKVISIPFNGINSALRSIKNADIMGIRPFSWINTISIPQIPRLAKGGVLYDETLVMAGEYSGASSNPEIVTPQNIMEDTFDKVMSRYQGSNNDRPINLAVYVGNTRLGQILLNDLRDMKRQTGKDIEAIVGG